MFGMRNHRWTGGPPTATTSAHSLLAMLCLCLSAQAQNVRVKAPSEEQRKNIPGLKHFVFESRFMKTDVGYNVVLPNGYDADKDQRYPVVYWLHGGGGNESSTLFTAHAWIELTKAGEIDPVILVYPNGFRSGYMDHADGKVMVESMIIRELIPRIDRDFRTIADRRGRAAHGFSMGSSGALRFAIKYPDLFCTAVVGGGGAVDLEKTDDPFILNILRRNFRNNAELIRQHNTYHFLKQNHEQIRSKGTKFLLLCGDTDIWLTSAVKFQGDLLVRNIPCDLITVSGTAHNLRTVFKAGGRTSVRFQDVVFKAQSNRDVRR